MKKSILLICIIINISCAKSSKQKVTQTIDSTATQQKQTVYEKDNFVKGEVIPSINLRGDSSQKFALYLPKSYSENSKLPVIIFFDPHGEGTIPLNLYYKLAEQYQVILIASNTSKNGMDLQSSNGLATNLINEAQSRFSVDKSKITLCGFSGGAKVALFCGANNTDVSTLIYCGAAIQFNPSHNIHLIGFAGKKDMNYTDVVAFEWSLKDAPFKHYLIEWKGKHEFPTADVFNDAFSFLKTGEVENYSNKKITITQQKVDEEQNIKQKYIDAFQTKDLDWWKAEIKSLNAKKKNDLMFERLLGFISLACYSISNNSLEQNNLVVAEKILTIYKLADPTNEACAAFTLELQKRKSGK
jgi:predicted esterase